MPQAPAIFVLPPGTPGDLAGFDVDGNLADTGQAGQASNGAWADSGGTATGANAHAESGGTAAGSASSARCGGAAGEGGDDASGSGAVTYLPGQKAIANGQFSNPSSAQETTVVLRITDPNTGPAVEPFVDGDNQTIPLAVPNGVVLGYVLSITAQRGDGACFHAFRQGIAYPWNNVSTISVIGTDQYTAGWSGCSVTIGTPDGAYSNHVQFLLRGDGGATEIQWVVVVRATETHF